MSSEIIASGQLEFSKNGSSFKLQLNGLAIDMSGNEWINGRQVIGTSEEALSIPTDIGTPGWILIINRDATNYVSLRRATGEGNCIKILHGEFALFRLEATAPYLIANTSSVPVEYFLLEA